MFVFRQVSLEECIMIYLLKKKKSLFAVFLHYYECVYMHSEDCSVLGCTVLPVNDSGLQANVT